MNILLTSVGRRSYLVKYFKEALGNFGEVHVSNSDSISPAFLYADKSVVTPFIYEDEYIPFLVKYCKDNNIRAIVSLFDIDLPKLSINKKKFEEIGVKLIVSNKDVIDVCNDKFKTYEFLIQNGFNAPKTYISLEKAIDSIMKKEISYPLIIKPRWGMGSIGVFEAENEDELKILYNKVISSIKKSYLKYNGNENLDEGVIIQEKLSGQEYGLDVINDLDGIYQNTIVKEKYSMRAGETDCAKLVENIQLSRIGKRISESLGHIANLDVDVFYDGNQAYILELNARFGGGYPFSHIAGVNLPLAIIKWLKEESIDDSILIANTGIMAQKDINIVPINN